MADSGYYPGDNLVRQYPCRFIAVHMEHIYLLLRHFGKIPANDMGILHAVAVGNGKHSDIGNFLKEQQENDMMKSETQKGTAYGKYI